MLLYRLQNKETGKFHAGIRCYDGRISWTASGAFFRQIDTIVRHLEYLIGEHEARAAAGFPKWVAFHHKKKKPKKSLYCHTTRNSKFCTQKRVVYYNKIWRSKLKKYQVVINDVTIMGERTISAEKVLKK